MLFIGCVGGATQLGDRWMCAQSSKVLWVNAARRCSKGNGKLLSLQNETELMQVCLTHQFNYCEI